MQLDIYGPTSMVGPMSKKSHNYKSKRQVTKQAAVTGDGTFSCVLFMCSRRVTSPGAQRHSLGMRKGKPLCELEIWWWCPTLSRLHLFRDCPSPTLTDGPESRQLMCSAHYRHLDVEGIFGVLSGRDDRVGHLWGRKIMLKWCIFLTFCLFSLEENKCENEICLLLRKLFFHKI